MIRDGKLVTAALAPDFTNITIPDLERVGEEYGWARLRATGRIGWFRSDGYVAVLHEEGRLTDATSDFHALGGDDLEAAVFDRLATPVGAQ